MSKKYTEYKGLQLSDIAKEELEAWDTNKVFEQSVTSREGKEPFIFFEGPPSANGLPGIHHVMGRTIKDLFCRYKTLKGYQVKRKAGWDTHGLPVELGVEKELGITKKDIGTKISIDDYNKACREAVMRYTDIWNNLTHSMGYWVDRDDPYITYENKYIESVWFLLNRLHQKDLLYKGYTIQPYSPAAGTGLSSHELNQPGCYRDVTDTTVVAQFEVKEESKAQVAQTFGLDANQAFHILAWTTTPWTLPSNTALAVGPKIEYVIVHTYNQYTFEPIKVVLAKNLVGYQFKGKYTAVENEADLANFNAGDKKIPYYVGSSCVGADLVGVKYHQLIDVALPHENPEEAFRVIPGDFVTTEDGTGIVHIAPTFGADDALVAKAAGVPPMLILDENNNPRPMVDLEGKFVKEAGNLAGKFVKNEYYKADEAPEKSVDVEIAIQLKEQNKAFKVEKYVHNYPHCWRTDKPVLYYPLDSWFIKTTAVKEQLIANNNTINWKPESTGVKRFGNWLENLNDWNLSRSRYWGIPIPIWRTEEGDAELCIGSVEELKAAIEKSIAAGHMTSNPLDKFVPGDMTEENYHTFDLHKNYADQIVLVSEDGRPMHRETDLIDVWFDSGAMPYAQWHYPFENKELIDNRTGFPADFIAEGVDQTRGWFFTLHAIATMCFDSVAYKNVVSNGLVLDSKGQKMSKRLGNTIDPFEALEKYSPDATRWYMISNAAPWDNLKFNLEGVDEVRRKFFGTLYNTYQFLAVYANIDGFSYEEASVPMEERPEIDRWIISKLHSLIAYVDEQYANYEPTKATRAIQEFTVDHLSNWYVRLCRRRFWKGDYTTDKIAAYQTLYECLEVLAQLSSPVAPFYCDRLFKDLNNVTGRHTVSSIHLSDFPVSNAAVIDENLEQRMGIAQKITSLVLSLRKKEKIKVRQPLQKLMVPVLDPDFKAKVEAVEDLILSELNIKELELLEDATGVLVKAIKPNFKTLGKKLGKQMKTVAQNISAFTQEDIATIERDKQYTLNIDEQTVVLGLDDVEITSKDIPGWLVATEDGVTVALDITINDALREEGIARELVNRIQNLRKSTGLEVTDKINLAVKSHDEIDTAIKNNLSYICSETLADSLDIVADVAQNEGSEVVEISETLQTKISIQKLN